MHGTATTNAAADLGEEEDLFRGVVDASPTAILVVDRVGRIVLANPAALHLFGYARMELLGQPVEILVPAEIRPGHRQTFAAYMQAPKARPMGLGRDLVGRSKDGRDVSLEISLAPVEGGDRVCVLATDITERKRIADGWALLAAIVESSDDAIVSKSLDGVVRSWNSGAEAMLGWTAAEIVDSSIMQIVPPGRHPEEEQILARIRAGESVKNFDAMRQRRDGSLLAVTLTASPIRDRRGNVIGASCIMRDVSERQRAEEQRALLAAIVESSDDAIIGKSLDGVITSWNAGAEAMLGWTTAEAIGQSITLVVPPGRGEEVEQILASVRDGQSVKHLDTARLHRDGSTVPVSLTISPIRDKQGCVIGASKIMRNVSERLRFEQALQRANDVLELRIAERTRELAQQQEARLHAEAALAQSQKMEAVGQLTGGIAHDFNNLLTVISGNLHFVTEMAQSNDRLRRLAASMQRAVERGARLTGQLLAFARRQPLLPEVLYLDQCIYDFSTLVQRALGESVQLDIKSDRSLWACEIDASQFEAAVLNLALNARDAMPRGGRLTITARNVQQQGGDDLPSGKYVAITVGDSGRGMTSEVAAHAIEPFYTTKEVGKGSGLGLSQAYGFVQQSGGALRIDSRLGEGTRITMLFPYSEGIPMPSPAEAVAAMPPNLAQEIADPHRAQVLVVEDDLELLDLVMETLTNAGLQVFGAHDGQEALAFLGEHPSVDLMLSDVVMPNGTSGVELGHEAQLRWPDLRVMLMSGYPRDELGRFGNTTKFPFLSKPFRPGELVDRLHRMLSAGA